jgi:hypothetical protein
MRKISGSQYSWLTSTQQAKEPAKDYRSLHKNIIKQDLMYYAEAWFGNSNFALNHRNPCNIKLLW